MSSRSRVNMVPFADGQSSPRRQARGRQTILAAALAPGPVGARLDNRRGDAAQDVDLRLRWPHAHPSGALFATFSAGVACYPDFDTGENLTEAADYALLEAKRAGRNRVVEATPAG